MNGLIKKIISCVLIVSILFFSIPKPVKAVAVVDDAIMITIITILFGMGVNSINNQQLNLLPDTDKSLIANEIYNKLPQRSRNEIDVIAKGIEPGKTQKSAVSNYTLQQIFSTLEGNLTSVPDPSDPNYNKLIFKTSDLPFWGVLNEKKNQVYFNQLNIKTDTEFISKDGTKNNLLSNGYFLTSAYLIAPNCYSEYLFFRGTSKPFLCKDLKIAEMSYNGKKEDITISVSAEENNFNSTYVNVTYNAPRLTVSHGFSFNQTYKCRHVLQGGIFKHCPNGNLIFYVFQKDNKIAFNVGFSNFDGHCDYFVQEESNFNFIDATDFKPMPIAKPLDFDFGIPIGLGGVGALINGLDIAKGSGLTITTTKTGAISLPTTNTGVIDTSVPIDVPIDMPIELPNVTVPSIISQKFPFCIPYDISKVFYSLRAPAITPRWEVPFWTEKIVIDFSEFNNGVKVVKYMLYLLFVYGLIQATRKLVKG